MSLQLSQPLPLQQVPAAQSAVSAPSPAGGTTAAGGSEQPFLRLDVWRALQLHRWLALGFAMSGLALAVAYVATSWPLYTAQSQIYIQPTSNKIMDQGNNQQRWPYDSNSYDSFIQQQVQSASNPDVLIDALHKLPEGSWQQEGESEQSAAERLGRVLKVERLGSSYQVAITAQAKDPELAAEIANAVANSIVETAAHQENAGDPQRVTILQAERDRVQNQLNADLAEQDALNKQLGMAAVGTASPDLIDNAIGATREELIKARTDHDQAEARFASLAGSGAPPAALDAEADELVANDPGLTSMKTSLNQRRATLIEQMTNLTPNNPEYKLDADELAQINSSLDSMMGSLRAKAAGQIEQKLRTDLERTAGVEAQLNGQLRQLAATAASATPKLQRANDLVTDIARLRSRYAAVDEELHNIMLQDSVPGAVHLSVAAAPPLHPAFAGILRRVLPLALGGLLLGLIAALIANNLDAKIYIGADVDHLLGFLPMASLPDLKEVPEEVFEEHVLRLATVIEHARAQRHLRNCIFIGTGPGTGVTTVVTRVKKMLVAMGRPAVLVDAMGTAHAPQRWSAPGSQPPGAAEGYGAGLGTRSLALLQHLSESATLDDGLVLTDTAPLTVSAETEYLAQNVDCAIVVIESGVTTRAQLRATADALQRLDVGAVGFVLNRVSLVKADTAFRNSVRGVEKHLGLRSRSRASQPVRTRQVEVEAVAAPPRPMREAKVYAAQAAAPVASPAAAARSAAPVAPGPGGFPPAPQRPAAPVAPAPGPGGSPALAQRVAPAPPVAPPAAQPESDLPWWLGDPALHIEAQPAPAMTPTQARQAPAPAAKESRLSGLKNLLFSRADEPQRAVPEPTPQMETPVYPVEPVPPGSPLGPAPEYSAAFVPYPEPEPVPELVTAAVVPAWPGNGTRQIMALPEFLPPRRKVEHQIEDEPAARRDRRETWDDVAVLPSWRGQYRRKG